MKQGVLELDEIIAVMLEADDAEIAASKGWISDIGYDQTAITATVHGYRQGLQDCKLWYSAIKGASC